MISEKLLQFIWQHQYFNQQDLITAQGEALMILQSGEWNHHQGPDFSNGKVRIGETLLVGSIELHVCTSEWQLHQHDQDPHYSNVVLHVVWEHDVSDHHLPVLELQSRIPSVMMEKYATLMHAVSEIPCHTSIQQVPPLHWIAWKERLVTERIQRKAALFLQHCEGNTWHWEEVYWWWLARQFGMQVNADIFERMARSLPLNMLSRHRKQIHQVESLLLGQCGMLERNFSEAYPRLLQREYRFLQKKYRLMPVDGQVQYLRMRPVNFPSVRLAQLAMLLHERDLLFNTVLESDNLDELIHWHQVTANDYWHEHYQLDEPSAFRHKQVGKDMTEHILINAIIPAIVAYGMHHGQQRYVQKAMQWLQVISAEENKITRAFTKLGVLNASAFDSQALIELKAQYCKQHYCLHCAIGNYILKSGTT